jgi:radical SAM superfamily enzyme YgiQ (UPF0313 family)
VKPGLIAISGVRAQNRELTALGLTLPRFVERRKVVASLPSLSLLTLAGLTPTEVETEYLEVPDVQQVRDLPGDYDVVAIASYTAQIKDAYALADRYRSLGTKVILGGLHVTALPREAAAHADVVVLGEGEVLWPALIDDLRKGSLQAVYDARGFDFDLSEAPMPRFDLLDPERYNRITVQTQRGCPFDCEFCGASIRISPRFKVKPVEKVVQEIRKIKTIWDRPFIEFADDNTFANRKHGKRLLRALAGEGIRWFTETDVSVADDEELLGLLRDSGCAQVLIGFESPLPSGLRGLERKSNWKARQLHRYLSAIERVQRFGITVNGCFILGLDGTDTSSFQEILELARASGLYDVQVTVLTAFPGTPLYHRLRSEGRLLGEDTWEQCTLFDVNFQPQHMTASELEEGLRWLIQELYSEEAIRERRQRFRKTVRKEARPLHADTSL